MKNNKMLLMTTLSLVGFIGVSSTNIFLAEKHLLTRSPASEEKTEKTDKETVICKSESKGKILEADIKNELKDKESILDQIVDLKKENKKLKQKLTTISEISNQEFYPPENNSVIALMTQMTSLFSAQMQNQMQMQSQMMTMISQMQNNMFTLNYLPNIKNSINFDGMNVGIPVTQNSWGNYQNPYSMIPDLFSLPLPALERQQLSFSTLPI